jgi:hypothetical protein
MKSTKPMPTANENTKALSGVRVGFAGAVSLELICNFPLRLNSDPTGLAELSFTAAIVACQSKLSRQI